MQSYDLLVSIPLYRGYIISKPEYFSSPMMFTKNQAPLLPICSLAQAHVLVEGLVVSTAGLAGLGYKPSSGHMVSRSTLGDIDPLKMVPFKRAIR